MIILMSTKDISCLLYELNTINGRSGGHYALVTLEEWQNKRVRRNE